MAARIARQLRQRLNGHAVSGDAFVVSVYGEWGVGKTHCLLGVQQTFEDALEASLDDLFQDRPGELVVPVFFDPWQFEHEEHLVIPLLKVIERRLLKLADEMDRRDPPGVMAKSVAVVQSTVRGLRKAGGVIGDVAVSLISGFKFKLAPLKEITGLEVDFSPKDVFDVARKAEEKRAAAPALATKPSARWADVTRHRVAEQQLGRRESMYFDIRSELAALTDKDAKPPLRLVVLIDDLDRCLPEKAIQVLESVKLFLNVPGFSFVLAVDDEVVERGIAHRYSPYLNAGGDRAGVPPISGAEYLEKIVHLPVHLQRWTASEAREFLVQTYRDLFAAPDRSAESKDRRMEPQADGSTQPSGMRAAQSAGRGASGSAEQVLDMVLKAVPLVPRKLIRLAEGMAFQREHFQAEGALEYWNLLHAARVNALQQLYPTLYRHLRLRESRYWRLFELRRDAFGEPSLSNGDSLKIVSDRYEARGMSEGKVGLKAVADEMRRKSDYEGAVNRTEVDTLREQLRLLRLVDEAGQQRGQPDPLGLFLWPADDPGKIPNAIHPRLNYRNFAELYLNGIAPVSSGEWSGVVAVPDENVRTVAHVDDPNALLEHLLSTDTLIRREYLEGLALRGHLPDDLFVRLLKAMEAVPAPELELDLEWLRDMADLTTPEQLLILYKRLDVVNRLAQKGATNE